MPATLQLPRLNQELRHLVYKSTVTVSISVLQGMQCRTLVLNTVGSNLLIE